MKQCLVSGMEIKNPDTAPRSVFEGTTYYFCCKTCKAKFDRHPQKYIARTGTHCEQHNCGCC